MGASFNKANCAGSREVISALFLIDLPPLLENSLGGRRELAVLINKLAKRDIFFDIDLASSNDITLLKVKLTKNHAMHRLINDPVVGQSELDVLRSQPEHFGHLADEFPDSCA